MAMQITHRQEKSGSRSDRAITLYLACGSDCGRRRCRYTLTNIDADHGDCAVVGLLRHGVLLVFAAPSQLLSLAGRERGRGLPSADPLPMRNTRQWCCRSRICATRPNVRCMKYDHPTWRLQGIWRERDAATRHVSLRLPPIMVPVCPLARLQC